MWTSLCPLEGERLSQQEIWKPAWWSELSASRAGSLTLQIAKEEFAEVDQSVYFLCILSLFMHLFSTKELAWIYSLVQGGVSKDFHECLWSAAKLAINNPPPCPSPLLHFIEG